MPLMSSASPEYSAAFHFAFCDARLILGICDFELFGRETFLTIVCLDEVVGKSIASTLALLTSLSRIQFTSCTLARSGAGSSAMGEFVFNGVGTNYVRCPLNGQLVNMRATL